MATKPSTPPPTPWAGGFGQHVPQDPPGKPAPAPAPVPEPAPASEGK